MKAENLQILKFSLFPSFFIFKLLRFNFPNRRDFFSASLIFFPCLFLQSSSANRMERVGLQSLAISLSKFFYFFSVSPYVRSAAWIDIE